MVARRGGAVIGAATTASAGGLRFERGDDDLLRRVLGLRNGCGIACGDVRDRRNSVVHRRIGINGRKGRDEAEKHQNRQPVRRGARPGLPTHVQHPVPGALIGFSIKPLAPDFLRS